jgi:DNA replication protein DnaC
MIHDELSRSNVPRKNINALASGAIDETAAITAVRELLDGDRPLLVLAGPRGTGKTVAAGYAVAERMRRKLETIEANARASGKDPERALREYKYRLFRDRERWGWRGPEFLTAHQLSRVSRFDDETWNALETTPLLIVDDLGVELLDRSGNLASAIDALVNARYAADLRFVATTNLSLADFEHRYGERVIDRLHESGNFFACVGASLRGRE